MTFLELREKAWVFTQGQSDRTLGNLKYIEHLAHATQTNIDEWNVVTVFGESIPSERTKINEMFFKYKICFDQLPAKAERADFPLEFIDKAKNMLASGANDAINELASKISTKKSEIERLSTQVADKTYDLRAFELSKRALRRASSDMTEVVQSLAGIKEYFKVLPRPLNTPYYTVQAISFQTDPIKLSYFNSEQAANTFVEMGNYQVLFFWRQNRLQTRVYPLNDNPCLDGFYHPHVNAEGNVCWGNVLPKAENALAALDFKTVAQLLHHVLNHYNDDNPYEYLHSFASAKERGDLSINGVIYRNDEEPEHEDEEPDYNDHGGAEMEQEEQDDPNF